jgi:hypothetical protein
MPGTLGQTFTADLMNAPGSNLNLGHAFDEHAASVLDAAHWVAWPAPQAFDANGNLLLATWILTNMGAPIPLGTTLTVKGHPLFVDQPCPGSPVVTDVDFRRICQEGGEMRVNGGPSCTVAVEERTWTGVRSLYR